MAKNLPELCQCSNLCKIESVSDKIGHLAEEISKQSAGGVAWFLLIAYRNIWEERDTLKELLRKMAPELRDLENSQPILIVKNENICSEENTEVVAEQPLGTEINIGYEPQI